MKIKKDGDMYLITADDFVNLQESDNYFFINQDEYGELKMRIATRGCCDEMLEPTNEKPVKVGDILLDDYGGEAMVLEVLENTFLKSYFGKKDRISGWYTFSEMKGEGWKVKDQEGEQQQEQETIEIGGRKYLKDDVENALKGIKEIK